MWYSSKDYAPICKPIGLMHSVVVSFSPPSFLLYPPPLPPSPSQALKASSAGRAGGPGDAIIAGLAAAVSRPIDDARAGVGGDHGTSLTSLAAAAANVARDVEMRGWMRLHPACPTLIEGLVAALVFGGGTITNEEETRGEGESERVRGREGENPWTMHTWQTEIARQPGRLKNYEPTTTSCTRQVISLSLSLSLSH